MDNKIRRSKSLLNTGWRIFVGDPPVIERRNDIMDQTYRQTRAENAIGAARRDYDDSSWRTVTIPHDYIDEIEPTDKENGPHGSRPLVNAWYRRTFKIDNSNEGSRITLLFDGVSIECDVYVNSMLLWHNTTAGTSFEVDITDVARFGDNVNVVSVYCQCKDKYEGWYYEGGGIYRNVWLCTQNRLGVDLWGTYVHPEKEGDVWNTFIETTVRNDNFNDRAAVVNSTVIDKNGKEIGSSEDSIEVGYRSTAVLKQNISVSSPCLWDIDEPNLYTVRTKVYENGQLIDEYYTDFGYRTFDFDPEKGLLLNGKHVQVRGFANHQTYAGVGMAMSRSMNEFRIKRMKDLGSNAFRCAHNPHAPELYDACDRYGMLVLDENRIFHSSAIVMAEVESMLRRDRNHPCIFMWSLYNEEDSINRTLGQNMFRSLQAKVRQMDATRPCTGATLFGLTADHSLDDQDVIGVNYNITWYDWVHEHYPNKAIYGSECAMRFTRTGIDAWREMDIRPWFMGGFMWTAWPQHNGASYPTQYANLTPLDNIGASSETFHMYKAYWSDEPYCKVTPDWDMEKNMTGEPVRITVFTNAEEAEVIVNGKSLGKRSVDKYEMVSFETEYVPGSVKAVAYNCGNAVAEDVSVTPGEPVAIALSLENIEPLKADGDDVAIITASLVDADGKVVLRDIGRWIHFDAVKNGEIVSSISSAITDTKIWENSSDVQANKGRAQVLVRSLKGEGDLIVTASAEGLLTAEISVKRETADIASVDSEPCHYIYKWKLCPVAFTKKPDMELMMKQDQSSFWKYEDVGCGAPSMLMHIFPKNGMTNFKKGDKEGYLVYKAETVIPSIDLKGKNPALEFEGIDGKADIYVLGEKGKKAVGKKDFYVITEFDVGSYTMDLTGFAPGEKVQIWVCVDADKGNAAISWPVRWTLI
ncbi:MAG: DUF4982 domain-containing protein [Christensenellaceae bacterium]|nr:DUF4982 domain-containing protein [Christensenellaceae bacterium]